METIPTSALHFQVTEHILFHLPVGLQKILALLTSSDIDVQIHAVKVIANLAAEGTWLSTIIYISQSLCVV